jgi:hypothetical protein
MDTHIQDAFQYNDTQNLPENFNTMNNEKCL